MHPIAEADVNSPYGKLSPAEFYVRHSVTHSSEFIINSRGLKLFTQTWTPLPPTKLLGIVAIVHGFASESSWLMELTAVYIARSGFATCAIDHQGHGLSEGLSAHIPDINPIVDDCASYFESFRSRHDERLPAFLYAESLGGAIALLITLRKGPERRWDGAVLNGAMCGISSKFKPPWPLEHLLFIVALTVPTWHVVPTRGSLLDVSVKEEWKRKLVMNNPRWRLTKPRAATARELLRVCSELQGRFEEVNVPLLMVHGGDDRMCDVACVEELSERAASEDKMLKVYPGIWHGILGEKQDDVDKVFGDVVEWLRARALRVRHNDDDDANGPK
ncbi:unnamed protein product [Rhodiola kirilowii]